MSGNNFADYIHSPKNVVYSSWELFFAWRPITTLGGQRIWLQRAYRRRRKLLMDIPQFPVGAFDKVQYSTAVEIAERKLRGLE